MSRLPDAKRRARPRPVYRRAELIRLLAPTSIAVVGASPNPDSFAGRTVGNLAGYHGRLWRVNSRRNSLSGKSLRSCARLSSMLT